MAFHEATKLKAVEGETKEPTWQVGSGKEQGVGTVMS